jgi:branched-chain amino acid transport system substrate-binding protein
MNRKRCLAGAVLASVALLLPAAGPSPPVIAQPAEIRIGNTTPYSGPASTYGVLGRTIEAFFRMVNDQGGINGRLITFISYDDMFNPALTLQNTRRLVEQDQVLFLFGSVGTPCNLAVRPYLNAAGVPQLFIATGAELFDDPANYPWTMRWNASFQAEARVYGQYIAATFPGARVGVLYQNDDFGADYVNALRAGLGEGWDIVAAPYDVTDPTVDAPIAALHAAAVDVFVNFATPRFAAQALRRIGELGWRLPQVLATASASVQGVIEPAGAENAVGVVTALYVKDSGDPALSASPDVIAFGRRSARRVRVLRLHDGERALPGPHPGGG